MRWPVLVIRSFSTVTPLDWPTGTDRLREKVPSPCCDTPLSGGICRGEGAARGAQRHSTDLAQRPGLHFKSSAGRDPRSAAELTFAGKDATAEFDMNHPPDVVEKYAPDAVIDILVEGGKTMKMKKMIPQREVTPFTRRRSTTRKVMCGCF